MATAKLKLESGGTVEFAGTPAEIKELIELLGSGVASVAPAPAPIKNNQKTSKQKKRLAKTRSPAASDGGDVSLDISAIVNEIKNCDLSEQIERAILDRSSQVDRTLLPLYVVHKFMDGHASLTSGDISRILNQLGVSIYVQNVSRTLSGTAKMYVMADGVRKKGSTVRYKISRRGVSYLSKVLEGGGDG